MTRILKGREIILTPDKGGKKHRIGWVWKDTGLPVSMTDDDDVQDYVRPWVELTDQEIELVYAVTIKIRKKDIMPEEQKMFARTIQEFLRKKNT